MAPVFNQGPRGNEDQKGNGESTFAFLDRVAGPFWDRVRTQLEDMVAAYCPDSAADVVARSQSGDDHQFRSAVWELFVHETLRRSGFTVTCHPDIEGTSTHPDFLAENQVCSFYVEARILGDDKVDADRELRRKAVYDEINDRVRSDKFWLRIQVDEESTKTPPIGRLTQDLQAWLDRLDPDDVRRQFELGGTFGVEAHTWRDDSAGWQLTFVPMTKNSHVDRDRVLGTLGADTHTVDDTTSIRGAVEGKASKYGKALGRPLVIALGLFRLFADVSDVIDALYGDPVLLIDPVGGDHTEYRKPNGVWRGPNGPRRDQLSAIVVCESPDAWRAADLEPCLWINPSATYPLQCEPPFMVVFKPDPDGYVGGQEASASFRDLLQLSKGWPGPEPPFPLRR